MNLSEPIDCRNLAVEGEKAIRSSNASKGIQLLEKALFMGSEDQALLSAIYSQLGNAYFALRDYKQARLYHLSDLNTSRILNDEVQQAKAYSNLSATYTMLSDFDNAIVCAKNVISIGKRLEDETIECRGYYNLGLAYLQHAMQRGFGNQKLCKREEDDQTDEDLPQALEAFENHLAIAEQRGDQVLCGLGLGNLGNTHFYAGNYEKSLECNEKRLLIAKALGDKASVRRTFVNIARAQVLLEDYEGARENYRSAIDVARELNLSAELLAQMQFDLDHVNSLIAAKNASQGMATPPNKIEAKSLCDAGTSPFNESFLQRTCKSMNNLDMMTFKPKKQSDLFLSAGRRDFGHTDDNHMFDLIDKLNGNRLEDQRVDLPPEMGMDSHSMNFDIADSSGASSSHRRLSLLPRRTLGTMKKNTIKSFTNLKHMVTSSSGKANRHKRQKQAGKDGGGSGTSTMLTVNSHDDLDITCESISVRDVSVGSSAKNSDVSRQTK